ncbi:MAG: hypothetical protein ACJ72N_18655 [Labedaea sp.]
MRQRVKRFAAALTLAFAGSATAMLAGSAAAAAAPPIVIGSCATSVQGTPGQPVSLSPSAVLGVVTDAVRTVPLVGPVLAGQVAPVFAGLPPIPIGALPTGTGYISGGTIANQVVAALRTIPLLGGVIGTVAGTVQGSLTSMCGVAVTGVNQAAAPVQDGAKAVADASAQATGGLLPGGGPGGATPPGTGLPGGTNPGGGSGGAGTTTGSGPNQPNQPVLGGAPGGGFDLGQFWTGRSPMADYSSIPFAKAGLFSPAPGVRYGGAVTGYSPQFGILGSGAPDGVQAAGHAEGLRPPTGAGIAFPILLAVFALSGVTAALVRTWVLRRAPLA